jgi:predicted acetyltransferase
VAGVSAPGVRPVDDDEYATWLGVVRTAMIGAPPTPEQVEAYRSIDSLDRSLGAFDADGQLCGTTRSFATELTVPGGVVPAGAVSAVGVLPTHRRQGHLTRLMQHQLDDMVERGEPVAVLIAAEYPIYGRFGYGPATEACAVELDASTPGGWRTPATGQVRLVDTDEMATTLDELYDRARLRSPGHIVYDKDNWPIVVGAVPWPDGDDEKRCNAWKVLWSDDDGQVQGAAVYSIDERWLDNRPSGTLRASLVVAATDEAERELVRYMTTVDWVTKVRLDTRPVDEPTPLWLEDGRRAVIVDRSDQVWARVIDVPAALTARRYGAADRLVIEVADPLGYAAGRFALDAGPDGASCAPTSEPAELALPVGALSASYLGGSSMGRLAAAGWVTELRPGAVARASALFTWPRAPWCARMF